MQFFPFIPFYSIVFQVELPEDLEDAVSLLMLADEFMVKRLKREVEIALLDQVSIVFHFLNLCVL